MSGSGYQPEREVGVTIRTANNRAVDLESIINGNEDVPIAKEAPLGRFFDHKASADMMRARSCVCTAI